MENFHRDDIPYEKIILRPLLSTALVRKWKNQKIFSEDQKCNPHKGNNEVSRSYWKNPCIKKGKPSIEEGKSHNMVKLFITYGGNLSMKTDLQED